MTKGTTLLRGQIKSLIQEIGAENPFELCRAIEQAVLQSDRVQEWYRDAERWRIASERWKVFRVEVHPGAVMAHVNGIPWCTLEDQADAVMETWDD